MIFTDEDLFDWKNSDNTLKMEALLARLEAAEKAIELVQAESPCNCIASPSGHSIFDAKCMRCKILEAWRKACGK